METKEDDFEILEKKYAIYVLMALAEHPMSTKTEIMRLQPRNERTKYERLTEMVELGLIEYTRSEAYAGERLVLTKDGMELAKILKKARPILKRVKSNSDDTAD